jgi:hypothetical protein
MIRRFSSAAMSALVATPAELLNVAASASAIASAC